MFLFSSTVNMLFPDACTEINKYYNVTFVLHASYYTKWFEHVKLLYVYNNLFIWTTIPTEEFMGFLDI